MVGAGPFGGISKGGVGVVAVAAVLPRRGSGSHPAAGQAVTIAYGTAEHGGLVKVPVLGVVRTEHTDKRGQRRHGHGGSDHDVGRAGARVALEVWLERIPEFTLADPSAVTWSPGQVRGPRTVPVQIG